MGVVGNSMGGCGGVWSEKKAAEKTTLKTLRHIDSVLKVGQVHGDLENSVCATVPA